MPRILFACFCLSVFTSNAFAEKNAEIVPNLLRVHSKVVTESFDGETLGEKFVAAKGEWKLADGVLVGKELATDNHAAVLHYQQPNRNSRIQFSFMLDGIEGFNLSFNHAKGHLFRLMFDSESLTIRTDKDKKDPSSKPIVLDKVKGEMPPGEWHTVLVEVLDDKVKVQLDNGMTAVGAHPSLAVEKPNYRFVMKGASLKIDDLKIWAAE